MLHGVSKERKFLCLSPRSVVFRGNFRGGKCWNEAISSRGWKNSISLPGLMKLTSIASFTSLLTPLFTSKDLERSRFSVFEKWQDEKFLSNYRSTESNICTRSQDRIWPSFPFQSLGFASRLKNTSCRNAGLSIECRNYFSQI